MALAVVATRYTTYFRVSVILEAMVIRLQSHEVTDEDNYGRVMTHRALRTIGCSDTSQKRYSRFIIYSSGCGSVDSRLHLISGLDA